jgi:hypothetical protein
MKVMDEISMGRVSKCRVPLGQLLLAWCGAGLLLGGCSTPKYHQQFHDQLTEIDRTLDSGNLQSGARAAEQLLADVQSVEGDYALQDFYAAALLSRAHFDAAAGHPFLLGGNGRRGTGGTTPLGSAGARQVSAEAAHLVAGVVTLARCRDLHDRHTAWDDIGDAVPEFEGQWLVPESVHRLGNAAPGPQACLTWLRLRELAALARLGFTVRFADQVQKLGIEDPTDARQVMQHTLAPFGLSSRERFWIAYGLHRWSASQRGDRYATAAFRYARIGYQLAVAESALSPEQAAATGMREWVEINPEWIFVDRRNPLTVHQGLMTDPLEAAPNHVPYLEFEAIRRPQP